MARAITSAPRFFPACAAALGVGGWFVYKRRIRRLREQFALVLSERGRIARQLHDTLLQGFSGITMAMQALASRLPAPSSERRALEDIVAERFSRRCRRPASARCSR